MLERCSWIDEKLKIHQLTHCLWQVNTGQSDYTMRNFFRALTLSVCLPRSHIAATFFPSFRIPIYCNISPILMLWTSRGIYCYWQTNFINLFLLSLAREFFFLSFFYLWNSIWIGDAAMVKKDEYLKNEMKKSSNNINKNLWQKRTYTLTWLVAMKRKYD